MPNQPRPGVTPRQVRVPDDLWNAARATAARRGENLAEHVLRPALETYVTNNEAPAPTRKGIETG